MKNLFLPTISLMLLAGCARPVPAESPTAIIPAPTPFACDTPGAVNDQSIPTSQGIDYSYKIYLPPCYESDGSILYPILYLVPGRGGGPSAWFTAGAAEIADELILSRQVAPFIIVTTQNTDNDMHAATITNELVPFVESNYPLSPERRHHEVAGGSLGGIAAYRIGFAHPDQFSSVGMFGSGAIHGEEGQIRSWLQSMTPENRPLVFLNSGWDDPLMVDRAYVMLELLDEYDTPHVHVFTEGDHSYGYWIKYLPDYIQWASQDW
jgi:enterochelin esterase family protein